MPTTLYTLIADFQAGTFISQVNAISPKNAVEEWLLSLQKEDYKIPEIGKVELDYMTQELKGEHAEEPTSILTVDNVWCSSFSLKKGYLLLNIIKTANA